MIPAGLRKAAYAATALKGLFTATAPRLSARLNARLWLPGYENTGDLEPSDWYVRAVRAAGVGMLAAGAAGYLLEGRAEGDEPTDLDGIDRVDTDADAPGDAVDADGIDRIDADDE